MLAGSLIFWAGAFYPPYKQWVTNDTREYLTIINNFRLNWYIIHGLFLPGVFVSMFGIQLISFSLRVWDQSPVSAIIACTAFYTGSIFWVLNIAFRLTVTVWVAAKLADTGLLIEWYETWSDWTNLLLVLYMVLSYVGIGFLGYAFLKTRLLPLWSSWFCILYGFTGAIGYLCRLPLFFAPLMVYLPLIVAGLAFLLKKSSKR
jgi:hypothetical protein